MVYEIEVFCLGAIVGITISSIYLERARMLRTRHEYYRDPVIRDRDPELADRALREEDRWI